MKKYEVDFSKQQGNEKKIGYQSFFESLLVVKEQSIINLCGMAPG